MSEPSPEVIEAMAEAAEDAYAETAGLPQSECWRAVAEAAWRAEHAEEPQPRKTYEDVVPAEYRNTMVGWEMWRDHLRKDQPIPIEAARLVEAAAREALHTWMDGYDWLSDGQPR